ncbi:hypothetical protein [Streptomyces sp. BV129]|uniref:hypothetical protein n=1 Tax=Streptomyces sp. BV129 TaxID=2849671 RepID=UPI001C2E7B8E|nr:hypothetical protein [Streptomyces sp. BV129]MBV1949198.1 hypothetical protein [Streptomyces sp. BV129]
MTGAFHSAVAGRLAASWAQLSVQALAFWLTAGATWLAGRRSLAPLRDAAKALDHQTPVAQGGILLAGLLTVGGSALLVQQAARPVLRVLEGYWPRWGWPVRRLLTARHVRRAERDKARWQVLHPRVVTVGSAGPASRPTPRELEEYGRLERRRRSRPSAAEWFMPTKAGNILRAAERRVRDKYGLDAVALWPPLWQVLPDHARQDVGRAGAELERTVTAMIWAVLLCVLSPWAPLAAPIGIVVCAAALFGGLPVRARFFAEMIETMFDLHRPALYRQLRWPLPRDPRDEQTAGRQLTSYLWRGSDRAEPVFTESEAGPS